MGGTAENGAGAVFHKNKICHVDGKQTIGGKGMMGANARVKALLFRCFYGGLACAETIACSDERG